MPTTTSAASACSRSAFFDELVSRAQRDAELETEVGDREEVLLSERLGRRHERALAAVLHRAEERVERDDGLARADVALQEPLHRRRAREVAVDLADRLLLVRRERERERLAVAADQVARLAEPCRERPLALLDAARDADLEDEELLEGEPRAAAFRLGEVVRPVHGGERVALERKPLAFAQLRGQRVGDVRRERQREIDDAPHARRRDLLRSGIDGREVGGSARLAEVVRARLEAEAAELAAHADLRSGHELVGEPRLVEPVHADGVGAVVDARDDPRPPAAHRLLLGPEDTSGDDALLAVAQRRDLHLVGGRLVAARPVLEDVPDGREAELRELALDRRADAGQRVEAELEPVGARRTRQQRPPFRWVQACEGRVAASCCHRLRHRARVSIPAGPDGESRRQASRCCLRDRRTWIDNSGNAAVRLLRARSH